VEGGGGGGGRYQSGKQVHAKRTGELRGLEVKATHIREKSRWVKRMATVSAKQMYRRIRGGPRPGNSRNCRD